MSQQSLPPSERPLTPFGYMQESFSIWVDFNRRAGELFIQHTTATRAVTSDEEDTVTAELLRTFSDFNLRHWQNTARLLDSMPGWMRMPQVMTGAAMTDWFDELRRAQTEFVVAPAATDENEFTAPASLTAPDGDADDLTRIKGIGPKLSAKLNDIGIFHFKQIADWSQTDAAWVEDYLSFKGRVMRENWIAQARGFTANGKATLH
ncbi:MAG: hypothetical protein QNI84_03030 [Henriciella sp.]|nr:hypothetical protein [Henriciella sp.]